MPKRKDCPDACRPACPPSLTSLDAALDLLACETFTRLNTIASNFEAAAKVKLQDGIVKNRWEEAVKRYWLMKSLDDLTCGSTLKKKGMGEQMESEAVALCGESGKVSSLNRTGDCDMDDKGHKYERPLPNQYHPGAVQAFELNTDEEAQWKRWSPKVGDLVLIDLPNDGGKWPGKIIDKKVFFQGRTLPRGNHFFPVRIYNEDMPPTGTIKSRLVPFSLRPTPPLLASSALLSAYNHAINPTTFDMLASARESLAARTRAQPPTGDDPIQSANEVRLQKESWKKFVNWLMDERRIEKMRSLAVERERRVREVSRSEEESVCLEGNGEMDEGSPLSKKKRLGTGTQWSSISNSERQQPMMLLHKIMTDSSTQERGGIFRLSPGFQKSSPTTSSTAMTARSSSPATSVSFSGSMAAYIRPALSAPRPASPRRPDRLRRPPPIGPSISELDEYSPRRGIAYSSVRTLPSGDEMAPQAMSLGPAPSLKTFDFVSPLGPVRLGRLEISHSASGNTRSGQEEIMCDGMGVEGGVSTRSMLGRKGSLEAVREEVEDDGEWTLVINSRSRRAGSAPCDTGGKSVFGGAENGEKRKNHNVEVIVGEPDRMEIQ